MIVFFLFGLSVSFFLFLLAAVKRNKTRGDYILMAWMAFMTVHLSLFVADYSGWIYQYPNLLGVTLPFPVLHGAFLYCYTIEATSHKTLTLRMALVHLLPFLFLAGLALPFYMMPSEEKIQVYVNHGRGFEWYSLIQSIVFTVCGLAYSVASVIIIRRYRKKLFNAFSNLERRQLAWLEGMAIGLGSIWLLAIFTNDVIIFSGVVFFVLFIGVFGINQTPAFVTASENATGETSLPQQQELSTEKYQKSGLTDEEAARLLETLKNAMESRKPYKNPDLTLDELAVSLNVNAHQLSQVINSRIGKSFYHYINSYRVKEFLALASAPDSKKFTFLGLATDCGFQSKTTFNKYFKMETGKTPSEYFQEIGV